MIESIYEWCLLREFDLRGLKTTQQQTITIRYKGFTRSEPLRFDLLVEDCVLIEIKAVESILPIHKAQLLSYMKLMNVPIGLLFNFNAMRLSDGTSRLVLRGASS